jgi:hypothetical protein
MRLYFEGCSSNCGYPLWLTGLDAPIAQKSYFKMFKNLKTNILVYIWMFYVDSPGFERTRHFFVACVKKTNFSAIKMLFI